MKSGSASLVAKAMSHTYVQPSMGFMLPGTQMFLITEWSGTGQAPALPYLGGENPHPGVDCMQQLQITCLCHQLLHIYMANINHKSHLTD